PSALRRPISTVLFIAHPPPAAGSAPGRAGVFGCFPQTAGAQPQLGAPWHCRPVYGRVEHCRGRGAAAGTPLIDQKGPVGCSTVSPSSTVVKPLSGLSMPHGTSPQSPG